MSADAAVPGRLVTEPLAMPIGSIQLTRGGPGASRGRQGASRAEPGASRGRQPLVYLHSAGGETGAAEVERFLSLLAAERDVYAPMLPGFAGSEGLDQIDDMEDAVYHTIDVLDRLGLTGAAAPSLVGQSLGGWLAAEIAWRHPERVASLVLVNSVGLYVPGHPMGELFGRRLDELANEVFADQSHPSAAAMHALAALGPKEMAQVPFDTVRPFYEAMAAAAKLGWNPYFHNPRLGRRLPRITAPTLVVVGRKDGLVPNAVGEELARLIPGARLEYVDGGSHMLTLEQPETVARLVNAHLGC